MTPLPSHPSVFTLLQFEHWQGTMGQKGNPCLFAAASAGQSEGSLGKCLFSGAPALSCFGNASLEDSVQVGRVCWCYLAVSVNSPMLPFAYTH